MDVDVQANGQVEEAEGRRGESEQQQQQQHQNGLHNLPPRSREGSSGNHVAEGSSSSTEVTTRPVIFHAVRGFEMRANDLIYLPPLVAEGASSGKPSDETGNNTEPDYDPFSEDDEIHSATNSNKVLVFFGGDIQVRNPNGGIVELA